jgi:arsenite-transporting ATPase
MRVVLYTGKGGVGKTTTAAATAAWAASLGHRTLVLSADAAHSLGDVLDTRLGPDPIAIADRLDAVEVDARVEIGRHWGRIQEYLVALFRYQGIEEVVAEELALLPGAEELTSLLAVDEYARSGAYDLLIVDCAPTDSTLRLATLPDVAHGAVRIALKLQRAVAAVMTPLADGLLPVPLPDAGVFRDLERLLYRTLRRLRVRLSKPDTTVRMVVTPERMVIDEARRAWTELSLFDLAVDGVVLNRVLPPSALEEPFFRDWGRVQRERAAEVVEHFDPVRVLEAPLAEDEIIGVESLAQHGGAVFGALDPAAILSCAPRVRFVRQAQGYRVHCPLPGAESAELDVAVVAGDLVVRAGSRRRAIRLPRRIAACALDSARLEGGELVVEFDAGAAPPRVG